MSQRPLDGVRVIDFTHALAGPFCTHHLALMGADVIKIEQPRGDDFRERPGAFYAINAGKRSVTLNLQDPGAREVVDRLVASADVALENFRPGVATKLGLEWSRLRQINPRLIYCSISGFGQEGELSQMPAIESSVQAASGLLAAQIPETEHPRKTPMLLLDPLTGYVAYSALLAALLQREKTGKGQRVDVAMADVALMISSVPVANAQLEVAAPAHLVGRPGMVGRPTVGRFKAKDRSVFISAVHAAWFERVCEVIGRPDLKSDPRFSTSEARFDHADALMSEWSAALAQRSAEEWEQLLSAAGVPAAMVRTLEEFASHPHIVARQTLAEVPIDKTGKRIRLVGAGVKFEHGGPAFVRGVPAAGEHSEEVLSGLGFTTDDIAQLRQR